MDNWQRIDSVIRWANMTINYFALYIGLPRGENLYQIKKGNNGISRNLADKIVTKFPEVSLAWLLTGEGQMFVDEKLCGVQIPFYQVDVESHITRLDELAPDREMVIPQLTGCDLAMLYNGKAMGCSIPSGSIVFLKKMTPEEIIPGLEYVIVCQKIITLRIVRTSERDSEWRLVAADRENFDDIFVKASDIEQVYQVVGKLEIKIKNRIMFSGIVERTVTLTDIRIEQQNKTFTFRADFCGELKIDQSIAHNGVCLTVVDITEDTYSVTAMKETLLRSNLGQLQVGDIVNVERSMRPDALLDGHIVQGHVDQTAVCTAVDDAEGSWYFTFKYEPAGDNCTVEKGSITVNGVSLTVCNSQEGQFQVAIIPYTYEHTNFNRIKPGTLVNLEFDIIGKYIARLMKNYLK